MLKLMRFNKPARAVVFEDDSIAAHDIGARIFLRHIKSIADDFENSVVTRKGKHHHDHAASAGRGNETLR
jgi:hypothetical protein